MNPFELPARVVGNPRIFVARQAAKNGKVFVASECPLAGMHIIQGMGLLDGEAKPPTEALHPIELMARAYGLSEAAP